MDKCKIDGCCNPRKARGWCNKHYLRWLRTGNPFKTKWGTLKERFESKYIPVTESGCWIWIANIIKTGYGVIGVKGKMRLAHRTAWELYVDPIPEGIFVLHKCDVRSCVNPNHLFLGTHQDNMADMMKKRKI